MEYDEFMEYSEKVTDTIAGLILGAGRMGLNIKVKDRPDYVNLTQATVDDQRDIAYGFSDVPVVAVVQACVNWRDGNKRSIQSVYEEQLSNIEAAIKNAVSIQ